MRADLRLPGSEPLGLKAAYAWVAHQRGEPVCAYPAKRHAHDRAAGNGGTRSVCSVKT